MAELLGAGVAKALLGKDVLSDELPWVTGSIGLLGTRPSYEMMQDCDTLLTVGSSFPYTQFMPELDQARAVQIDVDGAMIGMRYPYEVNLVGDAAATLRALIPLLERKTDRSWQEDISRTRCSAGGQTMDAEAHVSADPVNPMRIFHEFSRQAPEDAIIAADSGSAANWYARHIRMRGTMRGSLSGTLATMGPAVPYAIGAKFAHPDAARDRLRGRRRDADERAGRADHDRPLLADLGRPAAGGGVLHNNDLNQVTWELRAMGGTPKFVESQALPEVSYAEFAASGGPRLDHVTDPEELAGAWKTALSADRPYVLDVHCDPDIPPIPPHATLDQMTAMSKALIKGDTSRWGVMKEGIKTKAQEFLPHKEEE